MFDWHDWIVTHQATLRAIGLPSDVYLTEEHWLDFLENGHLHWHPDEDAGFDLTDLNRDQQRHLLRFLESQLENDSPISHPRALHAPLPSFRLLTTLRHLHPVEHD